ncbi:MAG: hypothetical protein IJC84_01985 [Clostridia bacterium]|nr:hypothetical protein [Clostridia bacterium]
MKRILTIFLVGILLLPSLFACGAEAPQATATSPVTTPAEPEVPAIEIGESGSTHEEYGIEIVEHAWSKEEAWLVIKYTPACGRSYQNWDLFMQCKVGDHWETIAEYKGEQLDRIGYLSSDVFRKNLKLQENPLSLLGLNHLFGYLDNGDYRLFITIRPEEEASASSTVEAWANFNITGMTPTNFTDVVFSQQTLRVLDLYGEPLQVFRSAEEWNNFCKAYGEECQSLEYTDFLEATSRYNEDYFNDRILILAQIIRESGGYTHEVEALKRKAEGKLSLSVETTRLGATSDIGRWFLFIEPEEKITVESAEDVAFFLDGHEVGKEYPLLTEFLEN